MPSGALSPLFIVNYSLFMKSYLIRSAKYFVALCVLCMAIVALNLATGFSVLTLDEYLFVMLHTPRGLLMAAAIVVLALFYPKFGFGARKVAGDVEEERQQILNALRATGFSLRGEEEGVMTFRADNLLKRAAMLWEDEIKVSQYGQWIVLEGNRRGVVRAQYRLASYMDMKRHG